MSSTKVDYFLEIDRMKTNSLDTFVVSHEPIDSVYVLYKYSDLVVLSFIWIIRYSTSINNKIIAASHDQMLVPVSR